MTPVYVDKYIPMPPPSPRGRPAGEGRNRRYPWRHMEIGDSFVFGTEPTRHAAASQTCAARRRGLGEFEIRVVREDGARLVRIWRTA